MTRRFIGVRWWLGAAFAVVAAVSTAIVVSQFSSRSENEFRSHAEQLAAGSAVLAAKGIHGPILAKRLPGIAQHFDLDLFVYGSDGRLVAKAPARTAFASAPVQEAEARHAARGPAACAQHGRRRHRRDRDPARAGVTRRLEPSSRRRGRGRHLERPGT